MKSAQFWQKALQSIVNPKKYFSNIPVDESYTPSVVKVIYYGLITGLLVSAVMIAETDLTVGFGFMVIFMGIGFGMMIIVFNVLVLFISSIFVLILSLISGGKKDYKSAVQVTAAISVLLIPILFLAMLDLDQILIISIFSAIIFYEIWMLHEALIYTFNSRRLPVNIISIFFVLLTLFQINKFLNIF